MSVRALARLLVVAAAWAAVPAAAQIPGAVWVYENLNWTTGGNVVGGFRADATGRLTPLAGAPFATGSGQKGDEGMIGGAVGGGRFLYVGNPRTGTVSGFVVDPATGALAMVAGSPWAAGGEPSGMALAPDRRFLWVADAAAGGGVLAFAVDPATGALAPVGGAPFGAGSAPAFLCVAPDGARLWASGGDTVARWDVDRATGALVAGEVTAYLGARSCRVARDGRSLFVVSAYWRTVSVWPIDPATGALGAPAHYKNYADLTPADVWVSRDGTRVLVSGRNDDTGEDGLVWYDVDPDTGELWETDVAPTGFAPAYLAAEPSEQVVFLSQDRRGDGGTGAKLASFGLDDATEVDGSPYAFGNKYRSGQVVVFADRDLDGLFEDEDNCPLTASADQTDTDGDGLGDPCDLCVAVADPEQADEDENGIGDACDPCFDPDWDEVGAACDNCPDDPNEDQGDADGDGVGDACDDDPDGDGIDWDVDVCPLATDPGQEDFDQDWIGDACDPPDLAGAVEEAAANVEFYEFDAKGALLQSLRGARAKLLVASTGGRTLRNVKAAAAHLGRARRQGADPTLGVEVTLPLARQVIYWVRAAHDAARAGCAGGRKCLRDLAKARNGLAAAVKRLDAGDGAKATVVAVRTFGHVAKMLKQARLPEPPVRGPDPAFATAPGLAPNAACRCGGD